MKTFIPPPVWGLITLFALWATHKYFPDLSFHIAGQKMFATAIICIGVFIDLISIGLFRRAKTTVNPLEPNKTTSLVTNGLYRYSRNPMYLGMLFILVGFSLWWGVLFGIVYISCLVVLLNIVQIMPEEQVLERIFGKVYLDYKNNVRRWI